MCVDDIMIMMGGVPRLLTPNSFVYTYPVVSNYNIIN